MSGMALRDSAHLEPGRVTAGVLAGVVHVVFLAFLIFGLDWKTQPPEGIMVDLWSSLPPPPPAVQPVIKAPPAAPKQVEPPPPEVKPSPPKPEAPPPVKADIVLKEKIEKPKPIEKKPIEKKPIEKKPIEKKPVEKKPPEKKQVEKKREEEKQRVQKDLEEQKAKEQEARITAEVEQLRQEQEANDKLQQLAAQSHLTDLMAEYKAKILAKIKRNIVMPPGLPGDPVAEFDVTLLPGGDILHVRLRRSSGYPAFDSAVERGILLSQPLPLPPDPALFSRFRNLSLKVHYRE